MAWSYRKRIKVAPGVRLNVSKGGVSTTFGVRGASITTGKNGTYMNTGIPGTGIYNRQKIGGGNRNYAPSKNNASKNNGTIGVLAIMGIMLIIYLFAVDIIYGLIAVAVFGVIMAIISASSKSETPTMTYQSQINIAQSAISAETNPIKKAILQNFLSCSELNKKECETRAIIEALKKKIEKKKKGNLQLEEQLKKHESELSKIENAEYDKNSEWHALQPTWVWRKRGIASLESACKIASYVARGKCV